MLPSHHSYTFRSTTATLVSHVMSPTAHRLRCHPRLPLPSFLSTPDRAPSANTPLCHLGSPLPTLLFHNCRALKGHNSDCHPEAPPDTLSRAKKATAPTIPRWSPMYVLSRPVHAQQAWLRGNRGFSEYCGPEHMSQPPGAPREMPHLQAPQPLAAVLSWCLLAPHPLPRPDF